MRHCAMAENNTVFAAYTQGLRIKKDETGILDGAVIRSENAADNEKARHYGRAADHSA